MPAAELKGCLGYHLLYTIVPVYRAKEAGHVSNSQVKATVFGSVANNLPMTWHCSHDHIICHQMSSTQSMYLDLDAKTSKQSAI